MTKTPACLFCYHPLKENETIYNSSCCKKFFGKTKPPKLPYNLDALDALAKNIVRQSVTVPGVQAKLSLHLPERGRETDRLTLVGLWGNYILKPPVGKYPQMPEIEDLTMHLARFFKIDTVPHGLMPLKSGELAYITRRIDRDRNGAKLPMEDMCQLTERLTEDKYKGSMEQIAKTIRKFAANPMYDVIRFFEITLFSFLTGNADMHLKNFSLVHDVQGQVHLSPAYDMLSTRLLISEKEDPEELALTLNGKNSKFNTRDFEMFAKNIGLTEIQVRNSMKRFNDGLDASLSFIDKSKLSADKSQNFKELISLRANRMGLGNSL